MITRRLATLLLLGGPVMAAETPKTAWDFRFPAIDGGDLDLSDFCGRVLLVVNTASFCGFTYQYEALEKLYKARKAMGLVIVGVPANNFGGQEPGTNEEIKTFCSRTYNVTFPMMSKVSVKGSDATPLYQYLTDKSANPAVGGDVKWNFTKFLVGKDGKPVQRFEPGVSPDSPELAQAIEKALK